MLQHNGGPPLNDSRRMVAIDRAIISHPVVGAARAVPPAEPYRAAWTRLEAWVDLMCEAAFEEGLTVCRGQEIRLSVGQIAKSRGELARRWNWSEKAVRHYIDCLCTSGLIQREPAADLQGPREGPSQGPRRAAVHTRRPNVLTVCNYIGFEALQHSIRMAVDRVEGPRKGPSEGPSRGQERGQERGLVPVNSIPLDEPRIIIAKSTTYFNSENETTTDAYAPRGRSGAKRGAESQISGPSLAYARADVVKNKNNKKNTNQNHQQKIISPNGEKSTTANFDDQASDDLFGGRSDGQEATAKFPAAGDIAEAVRRWNATAARLGLPSVARLTEERRVKLRLRLSESGSLEDWDRALAALDRPFLRGQNDRGWRANLDFVLQPKSWTKLLEGAYGPPAKPTATSPNGRPFGWWRDEIAAAKLRSLGADYWRALIEEVRPNGAWPWWFLTGTPGTADCLIPLEVQREFNLIDKYGGGKHGENLGSR